MLGSLKKRIKRDFERAKHSIKIMEVEETFDIYFSRFFGYYLALIAKKWKMNPNQVSIASLFFGILAGFFFYFQSDLYLILIACFLVSFSGVLDSADGQLARMTKQSSELGRKIDGVIDTLVFIAVYTGGAIYFLDAYSWWIAPIAMIAGYMHSAKTATYEFYKTEFIYYFQNDQDTKIPFLDDLKKQQTRGFWNKILHHAELDYFKKQALYVGRSTEQRKLFISLAFGPEHDNFVALYRSYHLSIMTYWALLCGANTHRTAIMLFSLFGRLDLYFLYSIITFFPMFILTKVQNKTDRKFLNRLQQEGLV